MSVRDTQKLNHSDLKYLLIDALRQYSEDVVYISGNNPYGFSFNKKVIYIYIKNVHESGDNRDNQDECRIQVSQTNNFSEAKRTGKPVIFLGYFKDTNTFTAWDPIRQTPRINEKSTVSFYSRFSVQERASKNGIAAYIDSNKQVVVSFRPEYLGLYLENIDHMHSNTEDALRELIAKSDATDVTENEIGQSYVINNETYTVTHKQFKRDPNFRKIVLQAYDNRCAFCGIQLDLVEAAHIIPHSHDKGTDTPENGICLCPLHHTAFDKGLIFINKSLKVQMNDQKIDFLCKTRRDGGLEKFKKLHFEDSIMLPSSHIYYPNPDHIRIANMIRGISNE